ncbi:achaete-scute homolog 1b-like [Gadus chalcogrammus]|uniref:achaete-scute homolog 1b-like n=1 Tax=Gadus chalcogrammus TaxID=1042646 RepID=UPI0024C4B8F7|nr:achaete-scute homolog 1b-like [Gadus chalcogrammus]
MSSPATHENFSQYTLLMISGGQTLLPASGEERCAIKVEPRQTDPEVLNRQRPGSPQLLRCVKRTHLERVDFDFPHKQQFVASVARRNERERNRVRQVNAGFQTLRQHVPNGATNGKLSKVETLRSAVEYIRALQQLLHSGQSISAAFDNLEVASSPSVSSGLSAGPESPHSTCSSTSEDGTGYGTLRTEEPELLDFSAWLHRYTEFLNN